MTNGQLNRGRTSNLRGRLLNANTLKYLRTGVHVGSALLDSWDIICALREDLDITPSNADYIIEELEDEIEELEKKLQRRRNAQKRENIRHRIEVAEALIKDAKRMKKGVPSKFIKTSSAVAGKWTGGAASGAAGAWAGASTGAACGACFGPAGAVTGGAIGAAVGGLGLGVAGGMAGGWVAEKASDKIMDWTIDSD